MEKATLNIDGEESHTRTPRSPRPRCWRYLLFELHYTKLCFCYRDQRAFTYTPWLPYTWRWQWIYLVYRWLVALYFLSWLVVMAVGAGQIPSVQAKFLIYLTNWGYLFFNLYLLVAALSVSLSLVCHRRVTLTPNTAALTDSRQDRSMNSSHPLFTIVNGLHWVFGIIGLEFAVGITVLFWLFFNDPALFSFTLSVSSLHVHMLNGIVAIIDTWITGLPFRILHFVYSVLFGTAYVVFTGVYFVTNGTDVADRPYIYPMLDYGANPGLAAGVGVGCALFFSTALHFFFYFTYLARYWLTYLIRTRMYRQPHAVDDQTLAITI